MPVSPAPLAPRNAPKTQVLLDRRFRLVPVMFHMQLCRFSRVVRCMVQVALSRVRVVRRSLMVARVVMFSRRPVVPCRVLVVLRCLMVVLCCFFGHASSTVRTCCGAQN